MASLGNLKKKNPEKSQKNYRYDDRNRKPNHLAGQVHDDKEQCFDEEKLMLQNPFHRHVLAKELDADAAANIDRRYRNGGCSKIAFVMSTELRYVKPG